MRTIKVANSTTTSYYNVTDVVPAEPYLRISDQYLPLTTSTKAGLKLQIKSGTSTYRALEYGSNSYLTSSVAPGNMSSTTALTRASTSNTTYLTRLSTSGTNYGTRASTSNTTYLTRVSTSDTKYGTRASTSGANYGTRASTSGTTYLTRASTSDTAYGTRLSTSDTNYGTSVTTVQTNTTGIIPINSVYGRNGTTFYDNNYATHYQGYYFTNPTFSLYSVRTDGITGSVINDYGDIGFVGLEGNDLAAGVGSFRQSGFFYSHLNTNVRTNTLYITKNDGSTYYKTTTVSTSVFWSEGYRFGSGWDATSFSFNTDASQYLPFQLADPTIYNRGTASGTWEPSNIYFRTLHDNYYVSSSSYVWNDHKTYTTYRIAGASKTIWPDYTGTSAIYDYTLWGGNMTFTYSVFRQDRIAFEEIYTSGNVVKSSTSVVTTGTTYLTRASTSGTTYLTRASTSDTKYGTRASTSATTYLTRVSTSNTTYLTRASTSDTKYGTRVSTSGTTYLTRLSTSGTNYGTRASTSGYSGVSSSSAWV